jgi:hypothetical protein
LPLVDTGPDAPDTGVGVPGARRPSSFPPLGAWALLLVVVLSAVVLYTDLRRFQDPVGERYVPVLLPGSVDFYFPYNGARALIVGVNPYRHDVDWLAHPLGHDRMIRGHAYRQYYPPPHLVAYVPLALVSFDARQAARIWFHLNLVWLVVIVLLSTYLVTAIAGVAPAEWAPWLFPFLLLVLGANPGVALALERGQSDILLSAMCWGGVVLYLRGHRVAPGFLIGSAMLMKGYPALLFAVVLAVSVDARAALRYLAGGALAVLVLLAPVARYLPEAAVVVGFRQHMFQEIWFNHSFKQLAYTVAPPFADAGRYVLSGLALGATLLCVALARRSARGPAADRVLAHVALATLALGTMLGYSALSVAYNLILVTPGAVVLGLTQRHQVRRLMPRMEAGVGLLFIVLLVALFACRLGSEWVSAAGFGLLGLIVYGGGCAALELRRGVQAAT